MKSHVWRPLYVVIVIVALVLLGRVLYVPKDFGIHESGYMYGFFRYGNIEEWKKFPVKYQMDNTYCAGCHTEQAEQQAASPHQIIKCEMCHGPALEHPVEPAKLAIDRSRENCLRCHSYLPYPTSDRAEITGIDPLEHNPGMECVTCHNAHAADFK